jgi:hypothetical protein
MIRNEGIVDRAVRVVVGLGLVVLAFVAPYKWLALVGVVALVTGFVGYCPLYRALGIRTRRVAT